MAKVKFTRNADVNSIPVEDGQLVYNSVTGETYEDVGFERIQTGYKIDDKNIVDNRTWSSNKIHSQDLKLAIKPTVSGDVITVNDSADFPLLGLSVMGKTTQSGVPTPEKPVPLVNAGADGEIVETVLGKNLLDPSARTEEPNNFKFYYDEGLLLLAGVTYTISAPKANQITVWKMGQTDTIAVAYNQNLTFTSKFTELACIDIYWADPKTRTPVLQMSVGSVLAGYESFKEPQTLTIPTPNGLPGIPVKSGGNYTDEKGQQWICDEIDLDRGVYVKRVIIVNEFFYIKSGASTDRYDCQLPVGVEFLNTFENGGKSSICSVTSSYGYNQLDRVHYYITANSAVLYVTKGFSGEIQLAGAITPEETPLSPELISAYRKLHTNYPATTVFNDDGAGQTVQYVADPMNYIDNKDATIQECLDRISALEAAIEPLP